jgi:hypothetical protein
VIYVFAKNREIAVRFISEIGLTPNECVFWPCYDGRSYRGRIIRPEDRLILHGSIEELSEAERLDVLVGVVMCTHPATTLYEIIERFERYP